MDGEGDDQREAKMQIPRLRGPVRKANRPAALGMTIYKPVYIVIRYNYLDDRETYSC